MKKEEDILDIFSESFSGGTPVGESGWQEISLKNESRQFWKWNIAKLNIYYVGLIVASFVGTFVLGADYYQTKEKITNGYQTRITTLERKVENLESQLANSNLGQKNKTKTSMKPDQGLSVPNQSSPFTMESVQTPNNVDKKVSAVEIPALKTDMNQLENTLGKKTKNQIMVITDSVNVEETVNLEETVTEQPQEISKLDTKEIKAEASEIKQEANLKNISGKAILEEEKMMNEIKTPVIKYVQDTIYEIDSNKVSRWRFKKSQ